MELTNKSQLKKFIKNQDININFLMIFLQEKGLIGSRFEDFTSQIDEIQNIYEIHFMNEDIETQNSLRLAFWAFFSKLLIIKLGGELRIAPKNDYCEGTPQLINYGNKFNKKGEKKWIGIGFDSWLNTLLSKRLFGTLNETIISLIADYS
jgi:hypothetical protein